MGTAQYQLISSGTDLGSAYKTKLEGNVLLGQQIVAAFQCYANNPVAMNALVAPATLFTSNGLVTQAVQTSTTFTAPSVNPRIDRVVLDVVTGVISVIAGAENAVPVPPTLPYGKIPVAQIALTVGMVAINNANITDERAQLMPEVPVGCVLETACGFVDAGYLGLDGSNQLRSSFPWLFKKLVVQQNGTTATSINVTALADTTKLLVGMRVNGSGVQANTTIASIVSGTAITLNLATTTSLTGTPLEFSWWGNGDGSTTFTLPDSRRRVGMGSGGSGTATVGNATGNSGGEEGHTLSLGEMPSHGHTFAANTSALAAAGSAGAQGVVSAGQTLSTAGQGSSAVHNNIQPVYVITKQIKY